VRRAQSEVLTHQDDDQKHPSMVFQPLDQDKATLIPKELLPSDHVVKDIPMRFYMEADPEILEALESDEDDDGEYEEIDDDFVILANQQGELLDEWDDDLEEGSEDESESEKDQILRQQIEEIEITAAKARDINNLDHERALLEQRFEQVVLDYDDEDIGELDEEDPSVQGRNEIPDDVMDEFLESQKGKQYNTPTTMEIQEGIKDTKVTSFSKQPIKKDPLVSVEVEDEEEDKWDCESIISTYSNTENHPKLIDEQTKNVQKIRLSYKLGIPLGVLPKKKPIKEVIPVENKGKPRSKEETPEERKERKKMIRDERKLQRERKKNLKNAYRAEEVLQNSLASKIGVASKSAIKI